MHPAIHDDALLIPRSEITEHALLRAIPRFKLHSEGDPIRLNDQVRPLPGHFDAIPYWPHMCCTQRLNINVLYS